MGQGKWAILAALVLAIATRHAAAEESKRPTSPRDAERHIEGVLDQILRTRLEFVDAPLNTILAVLAEEYQVPIQFDKKAIEAAAASPDQQISVNLSEVSLRSAMDLMLKEIPDLTFIVENEVLLITTEDEAQKHLQVKVYRVDDLISPRPKSEEAGAKFSSLTSAITSSIERDSWALNGSGGGSVELLEPGMLVVTQTQRVHRKIVALIDDLRHVKQVINRGPYDPATDSVTAAAP